MPIFPDNVESIGHTPLVRINRLTGPLEVNLLAKIEGRNPAYSVKCRIGAAMIWAAENDGYLKPGQPVVEAAGFDNRRKSGQLRIVVQDFAIRPEVVVLPLLAVRDDGRAGGLEPLDRIPSS